MSATTGTDLGEAPRLAGLQARLVVDRVVSSDHRGLRPNGPGTGPPFRLELGLDVAPGETVALLGPNGAGKSTAVAALAGLLALTAGRIVLDGRVVDDPAAGVFVPAAARHVGVVFQDWLLFDGMSVLDNVAFGLRSRGADRRTARDRAMTWLERLDLAELAARRPRALSGGQAQRVALARAMATEPFLLLLDEPLASLDVAARVRARSVVASHLRAFAGPRIVISHDPTEAFLLADRAVVIEDGRVVQEGTAEQLRLAPATSWVAQLAGATVLEGHAVAGEVVVAGHALHLADRDVHGAVLVSIPPTAVTLHRERPHGSQRNTWETRIDRIEPLGDRVRVRTGAPLALTIEITRASLELLDLAEDSVVWVAIKATELGVVG